MPEQQLSVQQRLTRAYHKSGMAPEQFYQHIVTNYASQIVSRDDEKLYFKIQVPEYQYDIEWFYYDAQTNCWLEG
jgi:hypothetical protein